MATEIVLVMLPVMAAAPIQEYTPRYWMTELENPKNSIILMTVAMYNWPVTAPRAKVGVKIPAGTVQLRAREMKKNFCRT